MNNYFNITRKIAILEGTSLLLLLFLAVPLKYGAGIAEGVRIIGPIHGVLFLAFITMMFFHYFKHHLNIKLLILGILASFIPTGTFIFKAKYLKT